MASAPGITGYSARQISFHGLPSSRVVKDAPNAEEAIRMADLDWSVSLQPVHQLYTDSAGFQDYRPVADRYFTQRDDTQDVLGVVGRNYRPFQNAEAFAFADALLGLGVEFDVAGHYANSTKVFLSAKLPDGIKVADNDLLDLYLLFKTSHDGSAAITAQIVPIRLSCTNQMSLAARTAVTRWSARHTANAGEKIDEAARTLRLVDIYKAEFEAIASQLLATEVDLAGFEALTQQVTASPRLQKGMLENWNNSPTVDRCTGWGATNAIGEFAEHLRGGKGSPDSRFDSNLDGQTANLRNRTVRLLLNR